MYTIENNQLKIVVNPHGAELTHVIDKQSGFDFMYDANPEFWGRKAPNLFPIVGRLKDNTYYYEDKAYSMNQHGFARDQLFTMSKQTENSLEFVLTENDETLKLYPFKFVFKVVYELNDNSLSVSYLVNNPSESDLYFSVGAHPGFIFEDGSTIDDYELIFSPAIKNELYTLDGPNVLREPTVKEGELTSLDCSMALFKNDALIYKDQFETLSLKSKKSNHQITMDLSGFPYVGIWTPYHEGKKSTFLCLEPWYGVADYVDHNQQFIDKDGINKLNPSETFTGTYKMTFTK